MHPVFIYKKELVIVMETYWTSVALVVDQGFLMEIVIAQATYSMSVAFVMGITIVLRVTKLMDIMWEI
jgi:hypothetical protein